MKFNLFIIGLLSLTSIVIYPAAEGKTKKRAEQKKYTIADVPPYSMQEIVKYLPYEALASMMRASRNMRALAQQELGQRATQLFHCWSGKIIPQVLTGHTGEVLSVAFSADDNMLASSSADKTIRLWDVATGAFLPQAERLTQASEFDGGVYSVAFSPDGNVLACGAYNGLRLWNLKKGTVKKFTKKADSSPLSFHQVAFSPYERLLATACSSSKREHGIRLFDATTCKQLKFLDYDCTGPKIFLLPLADGRYFGKPCHENEVRTLSFSFAHEGSLLASGGLNELNEHGLHGLYDIAVTARYDTKKHKLLNQFQCYLDQFYGTQSLALSPFNNKQLAIGTDHGIVILDIPHNSKKLSDISCRSVAFSPDGRLLAAGFGPSKIFTAEVWEGKGLVALWDIKTGNPIQQLETPSYVNSVKFSSNGKALAAGCKDGSVVLWKAYE